MAKLTFHGAIDGVTGSAYLLETEKATVLLDCGLFQGSREEEKANKKAFPFKVKRVDAVVLSHAHLDHSGRLPKLVVDGYNNPIYMTQPTTELLEVMLKDAASLQERDAQWENKHRQRAGKPPIEPLYTLVDVDAVLAMSVGVNYGQRQEVAEGIEVCFQDAGHILGSAIVEVFVTEGAVQKKLVFSGDLGNSFAALLRDPTVIEQADIVLLESTYGDRDQRPMAETLEEFASIIRTASENGGNILIPSFAVGRTQEIIFRLGELYQQGKLKQQAVFLDSPMAIAVTEIYHRFQNVFNKEDVKSLLKGKTGSLHSFLPILRYSSTTQESIALNMVSEGAIIIAGSGMCNGGRIRHHLKHNLWRSNAHVIFVGYQSIGTPGRALVDGAQMFNIAGERIAVKAAIHTLGGFSAHASQSQLVHWVNHFTQSRPNASRPKLYLVHGEAETKMVFAERLARDGWKAEIPTLGASVKF